MGNMMTEENKPVRCGCGGMNKWECLDRVDRLRRHYGIRCKNCKAYDNSLYFKGQRGAWCCVHRNWVDDNAYCTNFYWKDEE